jgi:alkanesulfonate monooxygenase SsuD/methylene tetrahydromethanopterin reductase-like flavin-dependent oxidoreductase (luciferase family)
VRADASLARSDSRERRAEAAAFAFLTLTDATPSDPVGTGVAGRLDPLTVAAFASATTSTIGLVPVVHTAHAEPFHVTPATLDSSR